MNLLKYTSLLFFTFLLSSPNVLTGQGWERTFGSNNYGQDIVVADNGDVFGIAHQRVNFPPTPPNNFGTQEVGSADIFRYNEFGERIFYKNLNSSIAGGYYYQLNGLCQSNDDGYLAAGIRFLELDTFSQSPKDPLSLLVKFDEAGAVLWEKNFEQGDSSFYFSDIANTGDGYVITGTQTIQSPQGWQDYEVLMMKIDNSGSLIWKNNINQGGRGRHLQVLSDGSIVMTGNGIVSNSSDLLLTKYSPDGNRIWLTTSNLRDIHFARCVTSTADGGFLVGAHIRGANDPAFNLYKFSAAGDTLWTSPGKLGALSPFYNNIYDLHENSDGTVWALVEFDLKTNLMKFDSLGNFISGEEFHSFPYGTNLQLEPAANGGLYIVGTKSFKTFLAKTDQNGRTITNRISGKYAIDNTNCALDSTDNLRPNQIIEIIGNNQIEYARTDANGDWSTRADTGNYLLKSTVPNNLWELCQDSQLVDFQNFNSFDTVNFLINETEFCPFLKVNISAPRMRRCFDNTVQVNYCNEGSKPAQDAYIEVDLDARLTATSATFPWTSVTGNTYRFEVGDLDIFECGSFRITTQHDCDSVQLGETFCMEAHIFPDSLCIPIDPLWDGSDLASEAVCEGDSVRFKIRNHGSTMQQDADFIIIEDDMVLRTGNLQAMPAFGITELAVAAEGSTYRIEVNQAQGHPFQTKTSISLEACGLNPIGQFSTGFVTMFSTTDTEPYLDMECVEVRGAYDPNDKEAFPKGVCSRNFIFDDTPLEYKIRFQNTGTDTAFRVEIRDTLSPLLDPMTLEIGGSSHGFDWDLTGEGILIFSFENIMLPDSNINEAASHGFIQYQIKQRAGNVVDAEIKNSASIYFDFNAPIKTNTVKHTIGDDFLTRALGDLMISGNVTREDGTPIDSAIVFLSNNCITFTDADGDYFFENIEENQDYEIRVMKDDLAQTGVTVLDIIAISNHYLRVELIPSPYSIIAADANNSGSLSIFDILALQKVIFELANEFPNNSIWRFFDKNGNFAPAINLQNLTENSFDNDFIGVKTGDVVQEAAFDSSSIKTTIKIDTITTCGDTAFVNVRVTHPDALLAGQFPLAWDSSKLNLLTVNGVGQTESSASSGKLQLASLLFTGQIETIIQLKFLSLLSDSESTEIFIPNDPIPIQFLTKNEELTGFEKSTGLVSKFEALDINFVFANPTSGSSADGQIAIQNITGGTGIYTNFQWSNGDTTSLISNLLPGDYTVTVTDSGGCTKTETITISAPSSDNFQLSNDFNLKITPNPTNQTERPVLQIKAAGHQQGEVIIYDISGKMLRAQKFEITRNDTQIPLPKQQASGMYLVTVQFEDGTTKTLKWTVN